MKTVKEVSKLTGVSVRTLHYYDSIGLLSPAAVTESGYRLYDNAALRRLGQILFFRELEFPLKEIRAILNNPKLDQREVLTQQVHLLRIKRERLDRLIGLALETQMKGANAMSFDAFDRKELDRYAEEVQKRWQSTDAYREYQAKTEQYTPGDWKKAANRLQAQFKRFSELVGTAAEDPDVQKEVGNLKQVITGSYYTCTDEILASLGKMYIADEHFRKSIDKFGKGTAQLASEAIRHYCSKR